MRPCILDIKMIALICIFLKNLVNPDVIALRGRTDRNDMIMPHTHYVMIIWYTLSAEAVLGSAAGCWIHRRRPPIQPVTSASGSVSMILVEEGRCSVVSAGFHIAHLGSSVPHLRDTCSNLTHILSWINMYYRIYAASLITTQWIIKITLYSNK